MTRILAIVGSNSRRSIHGQLAEWLATRDPGIEVVSLQQYEAPMFSVDREADEGVPLVIRDLHAKIARADALILLSPEHNGSMPAVLKNTVDWLTRTGEVRFFGGKPLLLLSASPGKGGGATNLASLATLTPWWGADVVGSHSVGSWYERYDATSGEVTSDEDRASLLAGIAALRRRMAVRRATDRKSP